MQDKEHIISFPGAAILVAGGKGVRAGLEKPKQFALIDGKELFQYPLDQFLYLTQKNTQENYFFDRVVLVMAEDYVLSFASDYPKYQRYLESGVLHVCAGGRSRAESVSLGIDAAMDALQTEQIILWVHDAARALMDSKTLKSLRDKIFLFYHDLDIKGNEYQTQSVLKVSGQTKWPFGLKDTLFLTGQWAKDTIVAADSEHKEIVQTLDRNHIFIAQTPQIFCAADYIALKNELVSVDPKIWTQLTDESSLFMKGKKRVVPLSISSLNPKVTFAEDLCLVEKMITRCL